MREAAIWQIRWLCMKNVLERWGLKFCLEACAQHYRMPEWPMPWLHSHDSTPYHFLQPQDTLGSFISLLHVHFSLNPCFRYWFSFVFSFPSCVFFLSCSLAVSLCKNKSLLPRMSAVGPACNHQLRINTASSVVCCVTEQAVYLSCWPTRPDLHGYSLFP